METYGVIYKITNTVNGYIYIGQTALADPRARFRGHVAESKSERRYKSYFHRAIWEYGRENFSFEIIDKASTRQELNDKEKLWIAQLNSTNRKVGYNITLGAEKKVYTSQRGRKRGPLSDEVKEKISIAQRGKKRPPEWGRNISKALKGRPVSENTRIARMNKLHTGSGSLGFRFTDEQRKNLSEIQKSIWKNKIPPWRGKKFSEEHKRNLSDSVKRAWAIRKTKVTVSV